MDHVIALPGVCRRLFVEREDLRKLESFNWLGSLIGCYLIQLICNRRVFFFFFFFWTPVVSKMIFSVCRFYMENQYGNMQITCSVFRCNLKKTAQKSQIEIICENQIEIILTMHLLYMCVRCMQRGGMTNLLKID